MMTIIHMIRGGLVFIGLAIMWNGWSLIRAAKGGMVDKGSYAYVRHPQYSGLFIIKTGILIRWPTIITVLLFAGLLFVYYSRSKREEGEMIELFREEYKHYMKKTPMFIPKFNGKSQS